MPLCAVGPVPSVFLVSWCMLCFASLLAAAVGRLLPALRLLRLLRLALVYGRFGVFASSWLWSAICRWPCPVLGFPLVFRFVMGYTLLCSFSCRCWTPAPGCGSCRPPISFALQSFWCVRFFLALECDLPVALSRTRIPASISLVRYTLLCSFGVFAFLDLGCVLPVALLRTPFCSFCWLPLLGACSRRCSSCLPPKVSFGLRSFWCVHFFLALRVRSAGDSVPYLISVGVSLCYGVYSSVLLCWLPLWGACSRRCPSEVSFGLQSFWSVRCFLAQRCVLPVVCPILGSCWCFALLWGILFSAPLLAAAVGRLLPALRLLPTS